MTFISCIKIADGNEHHLVSNATQVADYLDRNYSIKLSKWQATRLCNDHPYKQPKFTLPTGLTVTRLNSTIACTRNRARANGDSETVVITHELSP